MQYIPNSNIYNEKNETVKDCLTDSTQDMIEFLFGTVFTRSFKSILGIGTKQEGELCLGGAQCNGNVPGKIGALSCCGTSNKPKTCTPQISDWAGIGYCPSECKGTMLGRPGTCPIYEKCNAVEDDNGDGTTCTVNCQRKYPNKNAFSTLSDKCVTCNNEGKDPKTQSYVYERTLSSESASDACKMSGECTYYNRKDEKGKDVKVFQHLLTGQCYSCPNDATGTPYNRTLSTIMSPDACKAKSCEAQFPNQNSTEYLTTGLCYKCPENMSRTLSGSLDVKATDGCKYNGGCPAKYPGSFEHGLSGQCYKCPNDATGNPSFRTLSAITAPDACKVGGIIGDCSLLPTPPGIPNTSSFQDGLSGKCYSCYPGFRNLNFSGSGKECSMPCPEGLYRDELAGYCYKCPAGFDRNLEPVWSSTACTEGWNIFNAKPVEQLKPFVTSWTNVGSLNLPAENPGSILDTPKLVGTINSIAYPEGSLKTKPLTVLQDGPLKRKKKVVENFENFEKNKVVENPKYIGVF